MIQAILDYYLEQRILIINTDTHKNIKLNTVKRKHFTKVKNKLEKSQQKLNCTRRLSLCNANEIQNQGVRNNCFAANDFIPIVERKDSNGKNFAEYR